MTCINTIYSISNTLKKLLFHSSLHSSYIQTKFNEIEEIINNTLITYIEPLLNYINHPAFIQERKLNLYAAEYENKTDASVYKPLDKNKWIVMISTRTGQHQ